MGNIASLKSVTQWKNDACANIQTDLKDQLIFLVGTKKDLVVSKCYLICRMQLINAK
jgi:hypothetical protein